MMKILSYSIFLIYLLSTPVTADIYKCVIDDGTVKFSDVPCSTDAQLAFESKESKTFDEMIGDAFAYPKMPMDPKLIKTEDIVAHAKKIGECIIPGEYINTVNVFESQPTGRYWEIKMIFGPRKVKKYYITMSYLSFPTQNKGTYVYLNSFQTFKGNSAFDPGAMYGSKKFIRRRTGKYENNLGY